MTWVDEIDTLADEYAADVAAGLVEDETIVTVTEGTDLGWGSDLEGYSDLTADMRERDGADPMVVVEAMMRRITTPRGSLPDDDDPDSADYGIDVIEWLNRGFTPEELRSRDQLLAAEITKDDRVDTAVVQVVQVGDATLEIRVRGALVAPSGLKPFNMTLSVTSAEVLLKAFQV